jgi:hypothetical protein
MADVQSSRLTPGLTVTALALLGLFEHALHFRFEKSWRIIGLNEHSRPDADPLREHATPTARS